jgi:hypothetical protein
MGTMNADSPRAPLDLSVEAKMTPNFETPALVIKVLEPFKI